MTWRRKDLSLVAISLNTTLLRSATGEPVAMLNIGRDISDRKRLSLELEGKNKQIELVNRIISKANTTIEFDEIFQVIGIEISHLMEYDQINVGLLTDDETGLVVYASTSPSGKDLPAGRVVPIGQTVSQLAIRTKRAVVLNDLATHHELGPDIASVQEGLQSQISIPIFLNERVIGTFNVASVHPGAFTGGELSYLQPIADQIGAMVDRIRLFRKVSDDSKYIHNLLNSIDSVVFTIDRNYRVTEVNKAWREFSLRQGLKGYQTESEVIGADLADVVKVPGLWDAYRAVMPDLFERKKDFHAMEFELPWIGHQRTYHCAINPMVIDGIVTGLVFTNSDITEIKRTEEEVIRRNKELLALNAIGTSISKSLNLDTVLQVALEQVRDIVGADMVLFYLTEERKRQLVLRSAIGLPDHFAAGINRLDISSSATGTVALEGHPLLIKDGLTTDERVNETGREIFRTMGMQSLGVFPLQSKEKVLGALDIIFRSPHEFSDWEQQLLFLVCNQLGSAIENAILYAEVQSQVQRVTSLYELGKGLTGVLNFERMLEIVHGEVSKAIPLRRFAYETVTLSPPLMTPVFTIENGRQQFFRPASGAVKAALTEDSPLWNVALHAQTFLGSPPSGPYQGGSMIAVPVMSKQTVAGIITLQHETPDTFEERHLRLLESIANLTEIAMDKAMLYEDTVAKSLEIENRNRELDDFTYVVSHDLKEPLISIEGYSKILLKDYQDKVDQEGKEYLGTVVHSSARMKNLIDDLLTLSRLGRVAEALENVSVAAIVREILHDLQFTLRERNTVIHVPENLPEVRYNATQLSMVFRNLISNAMKFNDKPIPVITMGVREEEGEYVFSVGDNGIGIEKEYYDRIFTIFQRLQRSEEYRGTGAGLTIVKKIVERHRGRVWLESVPGEGTTFFFSVLK
jgi:PAS domain S-box-containing protein